MSGLRRENDDHEPPAANLAGLGAGGASGVHRQGSMVGSSSSHQSTRSRTSTHHSPRYPLSPTTAANGNGGPANGGAAMRMDEAGSSSSASTRYDSGSGDAAYDGIDMSYNGAADLRQPVRSATDPTHYPMMGSSPQQAAVAAAVMDARKRASTTTSMYPPPQPPPPPPAAFLPPPATLGGGGGDAPQTPTQQYTWAHASASSPPPTRASPSDVASSRDLSNAMHRLYVDQQQQQQHSSSDAAAAAASSSSSRSRSPLMQASAGLPTRTATTTGTGGEGAARWQQAPAVPSRQGSRQYVAAAGSGGGGGGSAADGGARTTVAAAARYGHSPLTMSSPGTQHAPEHSPAVPNPRVDGHLQGLSSNGLVGGGAGSSSSCGHCGKQVKGQFVRAMGKVFHLDCFRCKDCATIVAAKFFPVDDADGTSYPLCERDYFARLDLICGKCDKALRGSYITACSKKYHVEHFTCSVCDTVFGPQDSYYEHNDEVYCHFHYSTRFAVKCVGCANAILKQFVEINRNQKDECWHPECYMIHKFWNVKLTSKFKSTPLASAASSVNEQVMSSSDEESRETPASLRAKQMRMETQVEHIWRVLSAFEESSAACISEMLRFVSSSQYLEAVIMAEHFILHVEVLFAAIDDLEAQFALEDAKGMSHVREARMLCRKTVNFFSLLAHTQDSQHERAAVTQELLALVTGLAHYLKILIRIALTGSLKLEREFGNDHALDYLLDRLALLARADSVSAANKPVLSEPSASRRGANLGPVPPGFTPSTKDVAFGFSSLAVEWVGDSVLKGRPPHQRGLDHCVACDKPIDESCVRWGLFERWHPSCLRCDACGKAPQQVLPSDPTKNDGRQVTRVDLSLLRSFGYHSGETIRVSCRDHATSDDQKGFAAVSRLEQYAYLLNVALRRLYDHLKTQGVVPESPPPALSGSDHRTSYYDAYRDSGEIKRLKSVNLDRKLSATARTPQRSMVVESPSGKMAKTTGNGDTSELSIDPNAGARSASAMSSHSSAHGSPATATEGLTVIRPPFARNNTHIRIMDAAEGDGRDDAPMADEDSSPFAHEEGVTLADIPQLVEAEQAKMQHRRPPLSPDRPLLCELTPVEAVTIKHFALYALTKSGLGHLVELEDVLELMEMRKSVWWNKLFIKAGKDKKDVKRKGVFGVPLEVLVEKTGSDSQLGHSNSQLRVPEFIDNIVSAMKQMDMSVEGIFRKNGNIKRLNQVSEALDRDATSVNLVDDNPVQLAALLKKFLRDLPEPLMTYKLHKLFCAAQIMPNEEDRIRCLHLLVCLLPKANRDTMEVLFVFLKWVASFSHIDEETGSKMDIQNLATVISGSILYSKGHALQDDSFVSISAIALLIEHQDLFYHVPLELEYALREGFPAILASHIENSTPKSIYAACTSYITKRGAKSFQQRQPVLTSGATTPRVADEELSRSNGPLPAPPQGNGRLPPALNVSRPTSWAVNQQASYSSIPAVSIGSPQKASPHDYAYARGSLPPSPVVMDFSQNSQRPSIDRTRSPVLQGQP